MSAEMVSESTGPRPGIHARAHVMHPVVGVLDDGTPYFATLGEIIADGSRVIFHLCGWALRSVVAHLPSHGWTKDQYCEAFGLERGQSLEGPETRKLRAAALASRLVASITVEAVRQLGLAEGSEVTAVIKASDVILATGG